MAAQYRFLIDECLSPMLVELANARGFEAAHVVHRGLASYSDPKLANFCVENDMVIVTNNARDFRRIYATQALHPGLVVIVPSVPLPLQETLFALVLKRLARTRDLVNTLMEINAAGSISLSELPASGGSTS